MSRVLTRALVYGKNPALVLKQIPRRRSFHPEPRYFQSNPHGAHRSVYRWTIQAIATPFAVAYLCEKIADRSDGDSGFKLTLPDIDTGLLTEPIRMKTQAWGQM